jgi:hypothetical protein
MHQPDFVLLPELAVMSLTIGEMVLKPEFRRQAGKQKSNNLARNGLAFLCKPSIAVGTGSRGGALLGRPTPPGHWPVWG